MSAATRMGRSSRCSRPRRTPFRCRLTRSAPRTRRPGLKFTALSASRPHAPAWAIFFGSRKATGRPGLFARDAVMAYREVAARWTDLDAGDALMRSLELALQLSDSGEAQLTAGRIIDAARRAIAETDHKPGVSLRLIEALVEMPDPPPDVDSLLDQAVTRYQANIHVGDSIADMRAARAGTDLQRVEQIRREQAQRWLDCAATCEPMVAPAPSPARPRACKDLRPRGGADAIPARSAARAAVHMRM